MATFLSARWQSVLLFRLSQTIPAPASPLAKLVKQFNQMVTGADLAVSADVAPGLVLFHPVGVVIGPGVSIGSNCEIQQGVTVGSRYGGWDEHDDWPVLGDGVRLGAGARVLGAVHIGTGAVVGANSVVLSSLPDGAVAVGAPARVVKVVNEAL
ncbi:serine O-acetyltransferase [Cellulomonas palmilytica]|uniref:serine O-acetyltransferase n=1 Tax=Cellulomonas palmilytica TaxID=2608402 RepID=UPI001F187CC1|nr:DapH/DapD/GlmU-related protein [Cellulomonas palmilytica]UJP41014.1 serine acetyltransferase [Cellulomonas palmilytica]